MSLSQRTAKKIVGGGFYSAQEIAKLMSVTNIQAYSVIKSMHRAEVYDTEKSKIGGFVCIKVLAINEVQKAKTEQSKIKLQNLWRIALFGSQSANKKTKQIQEADIL